MKLLYLSDMSCQSTLLVSISLLPRTCRVFRVEQPTSTPNILNLHRRAQDSSN